MYGSGLRCEGVKPRLADGEVAGQEEVPHLHLHVIPRCVDDGMGFVFSPHRQEKLGWRDPEATADLVRDAL